MGIKDVQAPEFEQEEQRELPKFPTQVSAKFPNQVTTGVVRLVYPNLAEPRPADAEIHAGKYTCMVLIPKSDQQAYDALKKACDQAMMDKFKRQMSNIRMPIKDGDEKEDSEGNPIDWYQGHWYLNLSSKNQPKMIDVLKRTMDEEGIRSVKGGDWVRVRIAFSGYDSAGNKGVGSYVNVVQFIQSGDPLGGGDFLDDFEAVDTF